jgi:hypothetical protein
MKAPNHNGAELEIDIATIKRVCEKVAEPEEIWTALESEGIEATPGVVYQVMNDHGAGDLHPRDPVGPPSDGAQGLTARDVEILGRLARKAGGVDQLMRVLTTIERIPK